MPQTINSFVSSFSNELSRPSKFDVTIIPISNKINPAILRQLTLRCETAELPGRTFGTVDQKFGSNPTLKFPIHSSYNDLTLNFSFFSFFMQNDRCCGGGGVKGCFVGFGVVVHRGQGSVHRV